jgi:cobalt/nickel transport system permease protein
MGIANWVEIGRMDELGRMESPVHRIDARAKAVVTLAFIAVVMSFPRYAVSALTPLLFFPVALAALGRIPARHILKKILVAAPFALVIGFFNPIMDRQPVVVLCSLSVTGGWVSFASILFRFVLTVGAALVLVACTGMNRLGAGLGQLGVPRVFVVQLLFLYRYLFVVADEGGKMARSVELRSDGKRALRLRVYGSLIGNLLLRSMDRAERVYRAMIARGFDGEIRVLQQSSFRGSDWGFVCGWLAFFMTVRAWNLADGLGLLFTRISP